MNTFFLLFAGLVLTLFSRLPGDRPETAGGADIIGKIKTVHVIPRILVDSLPDEISESSGLLLWRGLIWTQNDSGGEPVLYGIDLKKKKIVKRIVVENAYNHDWESLAQDEHFIYVGDFGNNGGWRKDLCVYKIPKDRIGEGAEVHVKAEKIAFHYPEQKSFVSLPFGTRWDGEALLCLRDTLWLFTKDWKWEETQRYALTTVPGSYAARLVDSFYVKGLVTGAALSPGKTTLVLSGYESFYPYLWVFYDFPGSRFFEGKVIRVRYPEYHLAQTEGVTFLDDDTLLVSAEHSKIPGRIYAFSLKEILKKAAGEK